MISFGGRNSTLPREPQTFSFHSQGVTRCECQPQGPHSTRLLYASLLGWAAACAAPRLATFSPRPLGLALRPQGRSAGVGAVWHRPTGPRREGLQRSYARLAGKACVHSCLGRLYSETFGTARGRKTKKHNEYRPVWFVRICVYVLCLNGSLYVNIHVYLYLHLA